ncbi:organic cation transporter protein isoform X2 [Rhipicephalus microplus]|uniref:organic cation transporter protein isoform X1 n=1 Tax=Rhipicephalus microplus TaxID=6941 RepID=UPI003F6BA3BA
MDVTNVIGDYGKFQRNVYLFTLLREAPSAIHLVIYSFFFPTVEYWCAMPETLVGNITSVQWELLALPNSSSYPRHQCEFLEFDVTVERVVVLGNTSMPCETWEYGRSYYKGSMVQEWDLVCDRAWMRSLAQTATMVGMLVGTLMSSLGDKIGRRPIIIAGYVICLFGSVCVAVSPSFSILVASRALLGSGLGMGQSSSFCLLMEVIGLKERTAAALALGVGFSLGIIMLPGLAWFIQDWRMLQWAITTPFLAFIIWSWFLPESPRWLVAKGKMSAARKVILKACTDNRLHVDDIDIVLAQLRKKILQEEESAKKKASFVDLLRSRRMLLCTIVLVYASVTGGITFYGLQLSVTSLGGDPYLTFVLAALVEIPAVLVCYTAVRWFPRRPTMLAVYAGTALCTFAVCLLSLDWVVLRQICGIAGKMLASVSLALLWIFAAEIFPTVFRTFGVSACLVGTRIGSSTAPLLLELRTYASYSLPMAILVGFATLASMLMLLLPETFRVALPDTIHESVHLGNSKSLPPEATGTAESLLQLGRRVAWNKH